MFNTSINLYSIFIITSLFCYFIISFIISKKYNISVFHLIVSISYELGFIVFGAIFFTYISNLIKNGTIILGLSSVGGAIGAIIAIFPFCFVSKQKLIDFLTIYIIPLPLAYGVAKIACFLVGCCYGINYSGIGGITYNYSELAPSGASLFPVQLVEVILNIAIFIFLITQLYKNKEQLKLIADCFILVGISKFLTDFLRNSHQNIIISLNQCICLIFIIIGIAIYAYKRINKKLEKSL